MKTYKALFTLPDDVLPPTKIGFQINTPTQTPQGVQIQSKVFSTALMPIESVIEDCEDFTEVNKNNE